MWHQLSKHRPSEPMLSISWFVRLFVCLSVCLFNFEVPFKRIFGLFTNYAGQCEGHPRDKQGLAGTRQGQTGTSRDKQGHSLFCPCLSLLVHVCPCLSLLVLVCPCMSLSVLVCLCLYLYVSTFAIPSCLPLQMNIPVFISMNRVTLTFLAKGTIPIMQTLFFNIFFASYLASSITRSFNPNSYILVINITERGLHFVSFMFFFIVN